VKAVSNWQQSAIDGIIGPRTWKKMQLLLNLKKTITIETDKTVPEKTFYVRIEHGDENGAAPQTAIFVPKGTDKGNTSVDLLLYLHGFKTRSGLKEDSTIKDFFSKKLFDLRVPINESDRNLILVAPTMDDTSHAGMLAEHPAFFDGYIEKVLDILQSEFFGNNRPSVNKLILAAHSGGGAPMLTMARMKTSKYISKVVECWGFDSMYQNAIRKPSPFSWEEWLKDASKKYFDASVDMARYNKCNKDQTSNDPAPNAIAKDLASKKLKNFNTENSIVCHLEVPLHYMKERLKDPSSPFSKR
jgi:hypothetical protein